MRQTNGHHVDKRVLIPPSLVMPRHAGEEPREPVDRMCEPTGRERTFGPDEVIVTKADLAGRVTYANRVFLRVSGYTQAEVLGQPHNLIRHPDMPRCVFKLLWDSIQGGHEMFAFIVNMAKNGDHYWTFGHVTPTYDDNGTIVGYHSNRRCPERAQINFIKPLYEELLDVERRHARKADAVAASMPLFERAVAERHRSYEEFVFSI